MRSPRDPVPGGPPETPAETAAQRLWRGALEPPAGSRDVALAADRLCHRLRMGLGRWLGVDGYRALLDRAVTAARLDHAVLGAWPCLGDDPAPARAALEDHGAEAVKAGTMALVVALIDLLGRIMGDEMALHLVEQAGLIEHRRSGRDSPQGGAHA